MLVLTRKLNEEIHISTALATLGSSPVIVKVLSIKSNQVQLGIEAPQEVRIARGELLEGGKEVQP